MVVAEMNAALGRDVVSDIHLFDVGWLEYEVAGNDEP
jgi:hypothetical protein